MHRIIANNGGPIDVHCAHHKYPHIMHETRQLFAIDTFIISALAPEAMKAAAIKRIVLDASLAVVWCVFLSTQAAAASLHPGDKFGSALADRTPWAFAKLHNIGKEKASTGGASKIVESDC
jgi:hypothetical protein